MLAGALALAPVVGWSAEWALAPVFSAAVDSASNRVLREGTPESQSLAATIDLPLVRRTEVSEFSLTSHYLARRFTDEVEPDADDASLNGSMRWSFERAQLQLGAEYADESTLTTELAETGVVHADAARLTQGVNASLSFLHSDSKQLDASITYQNVDYTGAYTGQLYDYKYGAFSAGETFIYSERTSWILTAFGSDLDSEQRGSSSREQGISLGINFALSESTSLSGALGVSLRDFDGAQSTGTVGNFALTHRGESRQWSLSAARSVEPFGTGVLGERITAEFAMVQDFDSRLQGIAHVGYVRNDDQGFGSTFDGRTYRYADAEMRWHFTETFSAGVVAGYENASDQYAPDPVSGWSLALRGNWLPGKHVFGH